MFLFFPIFINYLRLDNKQIYIYIYIFNFISNHAFNYVPNHAHPHKGYTNSIYTLAVSAVNEKGRKPWYSEKCSSILAAAFSSGAKFSDRAVSCLPRCAVCGARCAVYGIHCA